MAGQEPLAPSRTPNLTFSNGFVQRDGFFTGTDFRQPTDKEIADGLAQCSPEAKVWNLFDKPVFKANQNT